MKKIGRCPDCGKENVEIIIGGIYGGVCKSCKQKKQNCKARGKEYIPYLQLPEKERIKTDRMKEAQARISENKLNKKEVQTRVSENKLNKKETKLSSDEVVKDESTSVIIEKTQFNPLNDKNSFIKILRDCSCEISDDNLNDLLEILTATDKLKDIMMVIARDDCQKSMLDLEQALNVIERKLQHDWEYNGFQEVDDIKFKGFLVWRRILKGGIFFWKKLYQTNALIEMKRAWNAYTQDPNDKILMAGDKIDTSLKRFQITTDSISTILNNRRPFTRVFYAVDKDTAYSMFKQWMADRQLHEDPKKTTIVELKN